MTRVNEEMDDIYHESGSAFKFFVHLQLKLFIFDVLICAVCNKGLLMSCKYRAVIIWAFTLMISIESRDGNDFGSAMISSPPLNFFRFLNLSNPLFDQ